MLVGIAEITLHVALPCRRGPSGGRGLRGGPKRTRGSLFEHLEGTDRAVDGAGFVQRCRMAFEGCEEALPEVMAGAMTQIGRCAKHSRLVRALHQVQQRRRPQAGAPPSLFP